MTNKSFLFQVKGKQCICRIPGPGTQLLVNRVQEKQVYDAVTPLGITEHLLYLNPETGYKIADFYEGARNASSEDWGDLEQCMEMLRKLHTSGVRVQMCIRDRASPICFQPLDIFPLVLSM